MKIKNNQYIDNSGFDLELNITPARTKYDIGKELDKLDLKLIRPLAEKNTNRVSEILAQKEVLRGELRSLLES